MEIYSPNSRSGELFQKNKLKSELIAAENSQNQAEPKPAINIQFAERKRPNVILEKIRAIKERLIEYLELNETTV
jgi:hypothetical protein